jgi:hypothetical protein
MKQNVSLKTIKYLLILSFFVIGCNIPRKPDMVVNGKEYIFKKTCIKSHIESDWSYRYGYNWMNGKWEFYWGWDNETICDEYKIDTVEINLKEKFYKKNI